MTDNQLQKQQSEPLTTDVTVDNQSEQEQSTEDKITPMRCFTGSSISGGLAFGAYLLAKSVVQTYANMPIEFDNPLATSIASTIRTLIMGITIMATFLFLMVTIGLIALGIKLILTGEEQINPE